MLKLERRSSVPNARRSFRIPHACSTSKGRVFISGCDSGIGLSLARRLRMEEYEVFASVLTVTSQAPGAELSSLGVHPIQMDVTSAGEVQSARLAVEAVLTGSGDLLSGLDAIICNAGIGGPLVPSEAMDIESFSQQLQVNLVGSLRTIQEFAPLLNKKSSKIIIMGSMSGSITLPFSLGYSVSKHGLESMADSLRCEFALSKKKISVVLIKSGPVLTPIWTKLFDSSRDLLSDDQPSSKVTPYREALRQVEAYARSSYESAIPCKAMDDLIISVIQTDVPRSRYYPGAWDCFVVWLRNTLPDTAWDFILTSMIKSGS